VRRPEEVVESEIIAARVSERVVYGLDRFLPASARSDLRPLCAISGHSRDGAGRPHSPPHIAQWRAGLLWPSRFTVTLFAVATPGTLPTEDDDALQIPEPEGLSPLKPGDLPSRDPSIKKAERGCYQKWSSFWTHGLVTTIRLWVTTFS
jgi:hypothetical protein